MSSKFIPLFFPDFVQQFPHHLRALQPESTGCRVPESFQGLSWPALFPLTVLGALTGLLCSCTLYMDRKQHKGTVHASWITGFLFFGCVCAYFAKSTRINSARRLSVRRTHRIPTQCCLSLPFCLTLYCARSVEFLPFS
jgi:hypothetical protein